MLVMDNRAFDANIAKGLFDMIKKAGLHDIGFELFDDKDLYIHVSKNSVFLYFPNCTKSVGAQTIDTELLIGIDRVNDEDGGVSLEKVMSRYGLEFNPLIDYYGFIDAINKITKDNTLKGWTPPDKIYQEEEEELPFEDDYSDDDVEDFLNSFEDDDEDYCDVCGEHVDDCECY